MTRQICSALQAAHDIGIIHRDLKPENMMINRQGVLKIMDFGLAMQIDVDKDANGEKGRQKKVAAGTPRYMAPEQFTGGELDQRTDIYAVGIILFTVLTGKPPFNAKHFKTFAILHNKKAPPPLRRKLPGASEALESIIIKALQKHKEDRYSTINDMLAALNNTEIAGQE